MTGTDRRLLKLAATGCAAFAALSWALHKSIPKIGIGRTFHGKEVYSLAEFTVATYCWAILAVLSFCVLVPVTVLFLITFFQEFFREDESTSHGFPVR